MGQVSFAQTIHAEQAGDLSTGTGKNQGTLKADGKEYSFFVFSDSESVTEAVSQFLQQVNQSPEPDSEMLSEFEFIHITQELIENEQEITQLLQELTHPENAKETPKSPLSHQKGQAHSHRVDQKLSQSLSELKGESPSQSGNRSSKGNEMVYSSLFSLARSFNTKLSHEKQGQKRENAQKSQEREVGRSSTNSYFGMNTESGTTQESRRHREGNDRDQQGDHQGQDDDQEDSSQQHQQQKKKTEKKGKKTLSIGSIAAARSDNKRSSSPPSSSLRNIQANNRMGSIRSSANADQQSYGSVDSIYIRFMALMARILGQAEYEAHQLYVKIKERTDHIDVLTLLVSKVNSEKGAIDWTNHEEMKQLIEKARSIGVDIPEGKYSWSEEEKKLLKENIQMRKDSMEKMTQLERTDMQRFLQEASQCHQARSNVLKLLKEVMDTIIANMRP